VFYEFKNQSEAGRELFIYGDIVGEKRPDWWSGEVSECDTDLKDFRDALDGMMPGQTLAMYVNSGGGSVFAASTMVSMLKRAQNRGVKVDAYVDGLAASAASWLVLAADSVKVYRNSVMMVHKPLSMCFGNANDLRHEIEALDSIEQNVMMPIYMERAKVEQAEVQAMIDAESWLGAEDIAAAFDVELIDEEKQVAACASAFFDRYRHTPKALAEREPTPVNYSEYEEKIKKAKGE
jgi:ATP-dependent protease ClpP protease subunit